MASTRKMLTKDGRVYYEINVSRGRDKSRLTRRWYAPDGWSRKAIERELAAVAAEFERQCDAGEVVSRAEQRERAAQEAAEAAKILTFRQYGERVFMPSKTVTMSENSRANYQSYLNKKIYPALGDFKLPEITPAQITALLLDIQADGKAHSTVIKVYTILHSFFKMAYLGDMVDRNPMDKVERPKPRKDEVQDDGPLAYTPAEVQKIITALEREPLKWQALVHLLIDTGIRRGECCPCGGKTSTSPPAPSPSPEICATPAAGAYTWTPRRTATPGLYTLGITPWTFSASSAQIKPGRPSAPMSSLRRSARSRCTPKAPPAT